MVALTTLTVIPEEKDGLMVTKLSMRDLEGANTDIIDVATMMRMIMMMNQKIELEWSVDSIKKWIKYLGLLILIESKKQPSGHGKSETIISRNKKTKKRKMK